MLLLASQCGEYLGRGRRGMTEEGSSRVQPAGRPSPREAEQFGDRGTSPGVPAAVGDRDERRGQVWMPHSVLPVPVHRPLRGSAPASTFLVQVAQPMDGYPS